MTEELTDNITEKLEESGLHYLLLVEDEDRNMHIASYYDYRSAMTMFAVLAENIMRDCIPDLGYKVQKDLKRLLNKVIKLNTTEPKEETILALEKMKKHLSKK